jgi:MFS transporter, MHS family, shikimate and dehydroshikimate transport protein
MPTSEPRRHAGQSPSILRLIITAMIGSALEWYDFSLYGVTAALVFAPLFFPTFSPAAGSLAGFATFAIGFLSRPLGGIIFSHYGDKIGRKPVLVATLMLMGVSTCLMGLLPTFDQIGLWAPIALVLLRLVQGLGAGAEYGGAALMLAEQNPGSRGFYGAFAASGVFVGIALSLGVFGLVTSAMSQETLLDRGWRVPFLLSVVVVGVGLYLRRTMPETPDFARAWPNLPRRDVDPRRGQNRPPPRSLRTNADDRLPADPLGRVEGGDGIVEGRDVADVRPQSSVPHPLNDLTQLGAIGHENKIDRQAVSGPCLGRPRDGHQCSSDPDHACGPLRDVAADDIKH